MSFWQFFRNWQIGWIGHAPLVQPFKPPTEPFFLFFIPILIFIYFSKFRYSDKATTKIWSNPSYNLALLSNVKTRVEEGTNFCDLLRISEL